MLDYERAVKKYKFSGNRNENECPSNIDSGLFGVLHDIGNVVSIKEYDKKGNAIDTNSAKIHKQVCIRLKKDDYILLYYVMSDVVSINVGHDHINDYCVENYGINLCYAGGCGYSTYGKIGFARRMRITLLENYGKNIKTWKILDEKKIKRIDEEYLKFDGINENFRYENRHYIKFFYNKCYLSIIIFFSFVFLILLFMILFVYKKNIKYIFNKIKINFCIYNFYKFENENENVNENVNLNENLNENVENENIN